MMVLVAEVGHACNIISEYQVPYKACHAAPLHATPISHITTMSCLRETTHHSHLTMSKSVCLQEELKILEAWGHLLVLHAMHSYAVSHGHACCDWQCHIHLVDETMLMPHSDPPDTPAAFLSLCSGLYILLAVGAHLCHLSYLSSERGSVPILSLFECRPRNLANLSM
jgi:hypothetical protein